MLKKILFPGLLLLLIAGNSDAQTTPRVDSTDEAEPADSLTLPAPKKQNDLQPVEIRSIRASKDAPFAKTDLKKAEIARHNLGQDLPVLLQYTPSVVINT